MKTTNGNGARFGVGAREIGASQNDVITAARMVSESLPSKIAAEVIPRLENLAAIQRASERRLDDRIDSLQAEVKALRQQLAEEMQHSQDVAVERLAEMLKALPVPHITVDVPDRPIEASVVMPEGAVQIGETRVVVPEGAVRFQLQAPPPRKVVKSVSYCPSTGRPTSIVEQEGEVTDG